ncbi:MAG: hypothetical protein QW065_00070 [Acidilobaceae archaeon]
MASTYGISVDVDVLELPIGETDSEAERIPVVYVEDKLVALGEPPSFYALLEAVFKVLEESLSLPKLSGFPILAVESEG